MKALLFALLLLPSLCFSGGVLPLADYVIKYNFGIRFGLVYGYHSKIVEVGSLYFPTVTQVMFYEDNFELGLGAVSTVTFKVNI